MSEKLMSLSSYAQTHHSELVKRYLDYDTLPKVAAFEGRHRTFVVRETAEATQAARTPQYYKNLETQMQGIEDDLKTHRAEQASENVAEGLLVYAVFKLVALLKNHAYHYQLRHQYHPEQVAMYLAQNVPSAYDLPEQRRITKYVQTAHQFWLFASATHSDMSEADKAKRQTEIKNAVDINELADGLEERWPEKEVVERALPLAS